LAPRGKEEPFNTVVSLQIMAETIKTNGAPAVTAQANQEVEARDAGFVPWQSNAAKSDRQRLGHACGCGFQKDVVRKLIPSWRVSNNPKTAGVSFASSNGLVCR